MVRVGGWWRMVTQYECVSLLYIKFILRQFVLQANSATNGWIRISKSYQDFQTAANIVWNNRES